MEEDLKMRGDNPILTWDAKRALKEQDPDEFTRYWWLDQWLVEQIIPQLEIIRNAPYMAQPLDEEEQSETLEVPDEAYFECVRELNELVDALNIEAVLRAIRNGKSQRWVARQIGTSNSTIATWLRQIKSMTDEIDSPHDPQNPKSH